MIQLSAGLKLGSTIMYVHRSAGDTSIFFIFKQTLPADIKGQKIKSFAYDYTYIQKTDSVSMLVTLSLKNTVKKIQTKIKTDTSTYNYEPELVYADPKKGRIEYRLRIIMPFDFFDNMYNSKAPFSVIVNYEHSEKIETLSFGYDEKKWLTNKAKLLSILDIIKLNVGKK